jgi:hypothetical protein
MDLRNLLPCLTAIFAAIFVADVACGSEIWVGVYNPSNGGNAVNAYDMNGNLLSSFAAGGGGIRCMAVVGNQIWVDNGAGAITRYDQSGNSLGTVPDGGSTMAVIGNQVWAYAFNGVIYQYSFVGSEVGAIPVTRNQYGIMDINGFAQVGNAVWAGHASGGGPGVDVYDMSGGLLHSLLQGQNVEGLAAAGSQVWVGAGTTAIQCYDTAGNLISSLAVGSPPTGGVFYTGAFAVADNEAWMLDSKGYGVFDLSSGQLLANYTVTGGEPSAIAVTPEPGPYMLLAFGLAGAALRRQ